VSSGERQDTLWSEAKVSGLLPTPAASGIHGLGFSASTPPSHQEIIFSIASPVFCVKHD
jgi:hypothetical protein